ncbi:carbohydrate-binding module family 50 protein [Stipitochalara longipes BDJ]|nr:carbohydrate-binding module family 50 protein [Stipitochalara longipes BDJ]
MKIFSVFTSAVLLSFAVAFNVPPPGPAPPLTPTDCSAWVLITAGLTCAQIEATNNLTPAQFLALNPISGSSCVLLTGFAYCLAEGGAGSTINSASISSTSSSSVLATVSSTTFVTSTSSKPSTTSSQLATSTTSGNVVVTPSPIQTGMVTSCNSFHLVASGDTCAVVAANAGISLSNFLAWNPAVGTDCSLLFLDFWVCTGIIGGTTTTSSQVTTTSSGNGITTPTPFQPGMITTCNTFHLVVSGDTCFDIANTAGIALTDFISWNPGVGSDCSTLFLADFVCIGLIGGSTKTTTSEATTTTSGNGITTPTPFQPGMITSCKTFHLVVSGDTCFDIANAAGVSLATFESWNPGVGSTCATLFLGFFVCIGIL